MLIVVVESVLVTLLLHSQQIVLVCIDEPVTKMDLHRRFHYEFGEWLR